MSNWKSQLRRDPTDWLLQEDDPSVRYFTLLQSCDSSPDDPQVRSARDQIMSTGVVPEILSLQSSLEYRGSMTAKISCRRSILTPGMKCAGAGTPATWV